MKLPNSIGVHDKCIVFCIIYIISSLYIFAVFIPNVFGFLLRRSEITSFIVWITSIVIMLTIGILRLIISHECRKGGTAQTNWKNMLLIIITLPVFFYVFSGSMNWLYYALDRQVFHPSMGQLASAFATGFFYFLQQRKRQKDSRIIIISSLQVILIFSALPYILHQFTFPFFCAAFEIGIWSVISICFIAILPEILGFAGLILFRKRQIILAVVFIFLGIVSMIEIYSVRVAFRYDTFEDILRRMYSTEDKMKYFNKLDRELEFKRSMRIIDNLVELSQNTAVERLSPVIVFMPDFLADPEILNFEEQDWPYFYPDWEKNLRKRNLMLNLTHDSDNDGLSDYNEALLLSDAYNKDTDGDGLADSEDSDPLNPFKKSLLAYIHAAVIEYWSRSGLCIVTNSFINGAGEIANFSGYVILLNPRQEFAWHYIFHQVGTTDGLAFHPSYDISFCGYTLDHAKRIAVVDIGSEVGYGFVLVAKWSGKWRVIAFRLP